MAGALDVPFHPHDQSHLSLQDRAALERSLVKPRFSGQNFQFTYLSLCNEFNGTLRGGLPKGRAHFWRRRNALRPHAL